MRAVVYDRYGPPEVLRLEDVERPVLSDDEVLVRVRATTVNRTDTSLRRPETFVVRFFTGLLRPKPTLRVVGREFAGEVEAVGAAVEEFEGGDRVFGVRTGANAEYVGVRESAALAHMPDAMSFEQAAAVCDGAIQALAHLRRASVGRSTRIVVYGASGSCGTAAVQLAKYFGAHVTAVCNTSRPDRRRATSSSR
jgi:NADPH:quinone reductase-like Zn-dependent oxidoreductase